MANYKRKRSRTQSSGYYSARGLDHRLAGRVPKSDRHHWTGHYPRHWDKVHHTRPARVLRRKMEHGVLCGDDPDNMVWPDGRKPHIYYW